MSIREFREKMKLESELAEIEEQLKVKAAKLSELLLSLHTLEKSRQVATEKKRAKAAGLVAAEREIMQHEAEIGSVQGRLRERASGFEAPTGEDDASVPDEEAREKERWEEEKGRIEAGLAGVKKTA